MNNTTSGRGEVLIIIISIDRFILISLCIEPDYFALSVGGLFDAPIAISIPTIIRSFKSSTTYRFHCLLGNTTTCLWQRYYYEHIIRDDHKLERVREYIQANPYRWMEDEEYPA